MISTEDLTAVQLEQLDALLADTTPGGGVYRPPVATDYEALRELAEDGLVDRVDDVEFGYHYEITEAGREIVIGRAMDAADSEAFVRYATPYELRESIRRLKAVFNDLTDPALRERTLVDIEACQDRLEELVDGRSESTGRHRVVPADDRPTETIAAVGTLPDLPVVERTQPDEPDQQSAMLLLAALKATPTAEELAQLAAVSTAGWQALEADLADERSWLRRRLRPHRVFILFIVATVVSTWFVAWLVMA